MLILKPETDPNKVLDGTDPKLIETILADLTKTKLPDGFVVRTTDQDKAHLQAQLKTAEDKAYSASKNEVDALVLKLTGLPRNNEEKTSDYLERAMTDKLKDVNALKAKIKDFENNGANGNALALEYKKRNEELEALVQQVKKEKDDEIAKLQQGAFEGLVKSQIDNALAEFRPNLRSDIDPVVLNDAVEARVARFTRENKAVMSKIDNSIAWTDPANPTITRLNKEDAKPSETKTLLKNYLGDLFDKGKEQNGAGSGPAGKGGDGGAGAGGAGAGASWKNIKVPNEIKDQVGLYDFLTGPMKMKDGTKEMNEAFMALKGDLPVEKK